MGSQLTDQELEEIDKAFSDSTQGEWKIALLRDKKEEITYHFKDPKDKTSEIIERKQMVDPRWDVYIGEDVTLEELKKPIPPSGLKGRKQILHMHPETPVIHERHWNLNDGVFAVVAHKIVPKLIAEIKRLRGENGTN